MKLKSLILFFSLIFLSSLRIFGSEITISGIYRGENLHIKNPFVKSGVSFCISKITVNNKDVKNINKGSIEINFENLGIKYGNNVKILIFYKDGCMPTIINPNALKPKSTFKIRKINLTRDRELEWISIEEQNKLTYIIEQYRWKKWIQVGSIEGKGKTEANKYSILVPIHTGVNKFRVKQTDFSKKDRLSPEVTFRNLSKPITYSPRKGKKVSKKIMFSEKTFYEIYDKSGKPVKKGKDSNIDVSELKKGIYYLNYDNQTDIFEKK